MRKDRKQKSQWYLYILKCGDGTFYTGITIDLSRRLAMHGNGTASRYTRSRLPVELIYREPCANRSTALKKEHAVKALTRRQKEDYISSHGR